MEARKDDTPRGAEARAKLKAAIELKNYEFNAHGVELGQRYRSAAVVPDGTPEPGVHARPGALLPPDDLARRAAAARVARAPRRTRSPRTTSPARAASRCFTGIGGEGWVQAAADVTRRTGRRGRGRT